MGIVTNRKDLDTTIDPSTGMQKTYLALPEEQRIKGTFRNIYTHTVCGFSTTMNPAIAETFATNPKFYSHTYCALCKGHWPVDEFVWRGTEERVGT